MRPIPMGMGSITVSEPAGLDFGPIYETAKAMDADAELLADVLPEVEAAIIAGLRGDTDGSSELTD